MDRVYNYLVRDFKRGGEKYCHIQLSSTLRKHIMHVHRVFSEKVNCYKLDVPEHSAYIQFICCCNVMYRFRHCRFESDLNLNCLYIIY